MSSYIAKVGYRDNDSVEEYYEAGKKAKKAIAMIMDGIEDDDMGKVEMAAKKAWKAVKTMCEISKDMEEQFNDRDGRGVQNGRTNYRGDEDWNERDDKMMERRMRNMRY